MGSESYRLRRAFLCGNRSEPTSMVEVVVIQYIPVYTYTPIPTVDPDPIINCTSQHLGVLKLRASVCKVSVECQFGNNWILYPSMAACRKAQALIINQNQNIPAQKQQATSYQWDGVTPPPIVHYDYTLPYTYVPPMPTTDPNLVNNTINQMNAAANNIPQMGALTPINPTPIPCSSLQGNVTIVGGNCQ